MERKAFDAHEFVARRLAWERTLARLRFESLAARARPAPPGPSANDGAAAARAVVG